MITGLVLAVLAGVAVAMLQATGSIGDPGQLVRGFMRRCDP